MDVRACGGGACTGAGPATGWCSRRMIRSCVGSRVKSLMCMPRLSTTRRISSAVLLGSHEATSHCAALNSLGALVNIPPMRLYTWQCPTSTRVACHHGHIPCQATHHLSKRSIHSVVINAGPTGGPSTSPSAASLTQYWRLRDMATRA